MSLDEYKLSCELLGHSLDVRTVCEGKNCIISGSRDKTAKIWQQNGNEYIESLTLQDHKNFISAVCVLDDGEWICTASNDSTICVYAIGNRIPFTVLKGHTSTVCAVASGVQQRTIITGSWDKTARIWTIGDFAGNTSIALVGHEAAVWSVTTLKNKNQFVTGSADKTIAFWNGKGERLKILKGHKDCVRGVIGINETNSIISCANDAVIKYWNEDGECIKEFHGHTNYIYSISMMPASVDPTSLFVSCGEDATIRMWSLADGGPRGEPIKLPVQSIWSICCLRNGDIVTGSSDGVVRVFTRATERIANEQTLSAFTLAVKTREMEAEMKLGGMNVNELPGPESLLQNGTEGQTRIVRQPDGKILCYQWTKNEWQCLGDVTGASGGTQETSGRVLHEGKEYDFVFNVDLSDTEPAIKLPYNKGEDPWLVAQKFIHKHDLPQVYLEQIANFVIKNASIGGTPMETDSAPSGFYDPFTGGSRYIPAGGRDTNGTSNSNALVDPFTGASSYRTAEAQQPAAVDVKFKPQTSSVKHYPWSKYMLLDTCDVSKVLNKLREFNEKLEDNSQQVTNNDLENIVKLTGDDATANLSAIDTLVKIIYWPKDLLFPVLDIARLAIRNEEICTKLATPDVLKQIESYLDSSPANQLMVIRLFGNMLMHIRGRSMIQSHYIAIVAGLDKITKGSANLQIAIATFFLNATIVHLEKTNDETWPTITQGILSALQWITDLEAQYRMYQALGNLSCTPATTIVSSMLSSVDNVVAKLHHNVNIPQPNGFEKLQIVAQQLIAALL